MIGREADEGSDLDWAGLAAWFAEAQVRQITDAVSLRLSRNDVAVAAPVVAAGVGEGLAAEVARRLRRPCLGFSSLIAAPAEASHCAPAVAVALLGAKARFAESEVVVGQQGGVRRRSTMRLTSVMLFLSAGVNLASAVGSRRRVPPRPMTTRRPRALTTSSPA